jgi:hypothetical protein
MKSTPAHRSNAQESNHSGRNTNPVQGHSARQERRRDSPIWAHGTPHDVRRRAKAHQRSAVVSTIGCVARNGPPDDFHNQPTRHANFGPGGPPPHEPPGAPERTEPIEPFEPEPTPWYRKPKALTAWTLFVLILIALIIYGIIQLASGGPTRPSPTPTPTTTTTTTTTAPATTTTTTPTTTPPAPPPAPATGPVTQPPAQPPAETPHHRLPGEIPHLPPLPSVITIPQVPTVITLPPHLP